MVLNDLADFRQAAMKFLSANRKNISVNFSGNSYQVFVPNDESPDGNWLSTLKINDVDHLSFASCNCPEGDCCEHLMIAYLSTYNMHSGLPLHYEFEHSFWYHTFLKGFLNQATLHALGERQYTIDTSSITLHISLDSSEAFEQWLALVHQATDTKIYTEKHFPHSVLYRIARHCFLACTTGAKLLLEENTQGFPSLFTLHYKGMTLRGEILDFPTLEDLFPRIEFTQTNLKGNYDDFTLSNVNVVTDKARIYFTKSPEKTLADFPNTPTTPIGSVHYIPEHHYVLLPEHSVFLSLHVLPLLSHQPLKKKLYSLLQYDEKEHAIRYAIHFLRDSSISFSAYLKEPNDLESGYIIYPDFCYLPDKGLFSISGLLSHEKSFIIKADQVEEFLNHKGSLIQEPGFRVFDYVIPEGQLTYAVTQQGFLLFHYSNEDPTTMDVHYGAWHYHSGQGFFLQGKTDLPIQDGLIVEEKDIPSFITKHEALLHAIPNFFSPSLSLLNLVFEVRKDPKHTILHLIPIFQGLEEENCRLFGPFLYQENAGFHLLPSALHPLCSLPKEIAGEHIPEFIAKYFQNEHILFNNPELCPPETYELILLSIKRPHPSSPLHLQLELKTNLGTVPLELVLQALKSKKSFLFSKAGFLNFEESLFQFFKQFIAAQKCILSENTLIATITDIFKLDALATLSPHEQIQASQADLDFFYQLKAACLPPIPQNLFSVDHKLRPYQNNGLLWLWFLYNHRLSGLLCDEMGLGKTLQATALLDIVFQTAELKEPSKFLIICPTSVLPHWENTLAAHIPTATITSFHGPNKPEHIPPADIIITSYGTLRQNYAKFYKLSFTVCVFDEIHMAKNKNSQIHKILCRLDSQMKLGLTGTPVENNLLEFKGLFDIILPNYLPSDGLFKKLFTKKNSTEVDQEIIPVQDLLSKLTRPFILRRTKKAVLPELPEKVVSIIPCSLSPEQKELYTTTLKRDKSHLQSFEAPGTPPINYLHVFALLNHLKQICDHPAVFLKTPDKYREHESGKWNAFVLLLRESLAAGYKVVVFSQYILMIRIIMNYLDEIGVQYASIQGKSPNRKEEIENFTTNPDCRVFVGSLLAAGTGINLTAGNVVIMYDRWWNPAKENQALDRVHRLGQQNTVFIYKLITEDTLEERIHYLIEKKVCLLDQVISSQDSNILHMLNREDLITILSYKDERNYSDDSTEVESEEEPVV